MTKIEAYENKCITKDYSTNKKNGIWLKIASNEHVRENNLDKNIIDIIKNCRDNTIFLWIGNNEYNEQYYNTIRDIANINKVYVIISEPDKNNITMDNILAHAVRKIDNIDGFLCIIKDDKKAYYQYGVLPVIEIDNYKHIANSFVHCFWKKACSEKIGKSKWKEYDFNEVNERCSIESNLPKDKDVEYSNESIGQPNIITIPFISDKDRIINSLISSDINNLTIYVNFYKGNNTNLINYSKLYSLKENCLFYRVLIDENNGYGMLFLINPIEEMDINNNNRYYIELSKRQCLKFSEMFHTNIEYEFCKEISLDKLANKTYYDDTNDENIDFKSEITEILDRPKVYDEFISKEHMEKTIHNEIESYIPKACKVKFIYDIVPKKINNKHDIYKQYKEVNDKIKNKIEQINKLIEKYKTNDEIKNISDCISYDTKELLSIHNTLSNFNTLNQINNCRSILEIITVEENINKYLGELNSLINNLKNKLKDELSSIKADIEENKKQKDNYRNQINNLKKKITTNKSVIDGNKKKIQELEAINKKLEESKNSNNSNQDNNKVNKNKNKNKIKLSKITTDIEEITKKILDNLEKIKGLEEEYNELQKDLCDKEYELENLEKDKEKFDEQYQKLDLSKEKLNSILSFLEKNFIVPSEKQNIHIPNNNNKKGDSTLENIRCKEPDFDIPEHGILLQDRKNNQLYLGIKYWEELDDAKKEIAEKYKNAKICITDAEEE